MVKIKDVAWKMTKEMQDAGYSETTVWGVYTNSMLPLIKHFEQSGTEYYDEDVKADYVRQVKARRAAGKISRGHCAHLLAGVEKLARVYATGKIEWVFPTRISKFKLNDYYEKLLDNYIGYNNLHPNTRGDVIWITRKFFAWLIQNGYESLENVSAETIQKFMIHCSGYMQSNSVYDVQLYMRKLCVYLANHDYLQRNYNELLTMRVSREAKMYPPTPQEEIAEVLAQIDRSTIKGKRDYAIILLGAVTGLRAVDIIRLKLSSFDWKTGEIKIVQSKTGRTLVLPLTTDVGEAVKDYILRARQTSTSDAVFIRLMPPFVGVKDAWSIGYIYDTYRQKAGLPRESFDGKCFHSLRRSLGKSMVTSGVPVTTVAQVLGHDEIESVKKYISLDTEHLKECALGFLGIEVGNGGERHE